jgi:hypothetical protein
MPEEIKTQENEAEENEAEEEDENGDHPLDVLSSAIEDVNDQVKRLQNRRHGDLKFELMNNIYPIISKALVAVYEILYDLDDTVNGENEQSEAEIQAAIERETKRIKEACEKIMKVDLMFPTLATDMNWVDVTKWAKDVLNPQTQVQA